MIRRGAAVLVGRLVQVFDALAMAALAALAGVVAVSIAGRAVFDATGGAVDLLVPGAIELSGLALTIMVMAALPGAAIRGLTRVDLLIDRLPARVQALAEGAWALLLAVLAALLAWLLSARALREAAGGHLTQDLGLPLWPFTGFAALAALLLILAALSRLSSPGR
ncbi:MAG: TRAP transporter small permease subunit [Pseudomonadota bacterium]